MTASATTSTDLYTLSQRLSEGEMPAAEALRYATAIAESLRDLHDSGKVHGWLTPTTIAITGTGLQILDSFVTPEEAKNYTAPEVLGGDPADVRSDVFSLGAVLSAMLTGPRASEGDAGHSPAPIRLCHPAVEHFLSLCMAHNPADRPQRMQKVMLELKFLMITARRAEAQSAASTVREEVAHSIESLTQRLLAAEQEIDELRRYSTTLEEKVAASLHSHEELLREHAVAIESAQSSTEQTDNLVERMVDALDLVQSTLIDQASVAHPLN
jgi:serine/threonine protein kinase